MNVSVDKVSGLENLHKPEKGLKAQVAPVVFVMDAPWRGVGKEYVHKTAEKNAVPQKPGNEFYYFKEHFKLGILIWPPVVAHGPSQPRHNEVFLDCNL